MFKWPKRKLQIYIHELQKDFKRFRMSKMGISPLFQSVIMPGNHGNTVVSELAGHLQHSTAIVDNAAFVVSANVFILLLLNILIMLERSARLWLWLV